MDIISKLNESKRRTNIMNSVGIDWTAARELIPHVLNESKNFTEEFKLSAKTLHILFENMEKGIEELKNLIPRVDE